MGCLMPKSHHLDQNKVKQRDDWPSKTYSWSNRDKSQIFKYVIKNESNSIQIRLPGEINGEQFIIQNCNDSTICIYDFINTVSIDDCRNCTFFIGPVTGSIVLRNCQDCRLMSASQQFRCRDCKRLNLYLFSATQPAIESCYDLVFACFSANYRGLQEQFEKANLKIYNNKWFNVYDFSIDNREKHWTTISSDLKVNEHFCSIPLDNDLNLCFNPLTSLVPTTEGIISFDNLKVESQLIMENNVGEYQLVIIVVYSHSSGASIIHNTIESQVSKIIQEIRLSLKELMLLITKYLDTETTIKTLIQILNGNETKMSLSGENKSNQMIVLLFRGNFAFDKLYEICQRILQDVQGIPEMKFKIILRDQNELIFNNSLSLVFENSF